MSSHPDEKIWCAACGKWGDHGSGTCPTISHPTAAETVRELVRQIRRQDYRSDFYLTEDAACDNVRALIDRVAAIGSQAIRKENTHLRAALATSNDPCVYCQLPAHEMGKCRAGFPGCARADDLSGCPEFGAAMALGELSRHIKEAFYKKFGQHAMDRDWRLRQEGMNVALDLLPSHHQQHESQPPAPPS